MFNNPAEAGIHSGVHVVDSSFRRIDDMMLAPIENLIVFSG